MPSAIERWHSQQSDLPVLIRALRAVLFDRYHHLWKDGNKPAVGIEKRLPDGLSKRDVRHKFKQCPNSKEIIKRMYPQIDCTGSAYMRNQVFLEKIREDNRWVELYNMIK